MLMRRDAGEAVANNENIWDGGIKKYYCPQHGPFMVFEQYKQITWIVGKLISVTRLQFYCKAELHGSHF